MEARDAERFRCEAAGVEVLASKAVVTRGDAVGGDDLAYVVEKGGAAGPVRTIEQIQAHKKDNLQKPWEGAECAVADNGR